MQASGILNKLVYEEPKIFQTLKSWYEPDVIGIKERIKIPEQMPYASRLKVDKSPNNAQTWNEFANNKTK